MGGKVADAVANGATELIVGGQIQTNSTKAMVSDLASNVAQEAISAATSGGIDPTGLSTVIHIAGDVGGLLWKAGAYLNHKNTVKAQLSVCLGEYQAAGYLTTNTAVGSAKVTSWTTTPKLQNANMTRSLGLNLEISLHVEEKLGNITQRLSLSCHKAGVKDITKTDAKKRIANLSFVHMGAIALQNAFIAEGQKRERGETPVVVPVLERAIGLIGMCGITEITLSDITTILGKAPMFEIVARARIAKLRDSHAKSIAKGFGQEAQSFKCQRVVVGRVKSKKKVELLPEYDGIHCELVGSVDKKHEVGKPVYMLDGWANLIRQREAIDRKHGVMTQMVHIHAPTTATDIHGNHYMSAGKLGKIVFKVKELPDGTLMAKPRDFDKFDYKYKADYNKGKGGSEATGEEKLFGGIVGPTVCKCQGTADIEKGNLTKKWKHGKLKIDSYDYLGNSIQHTKDMSTKKTSILWRPGDWAMGCFFMSVLPQSSYLQGRGECLYCAVENAALAGCPEVIACGGGRVSAEALEAHKRDVEAEKLQVRTTTVATEPSTKVVFPPVSSPLSPPMSPPPPYGSPSPPDMFEYFVSSDANRDKIVPAVSRKPVPTSIGVGEKSMLLVPPEQQTTSTIKRKPVATVNEFDAIEQAAAC